MRRRIIKSPIELSAADTILIQTCEFEHPKLEMQTVQHPTVSRRQTPDPLRKSLKKSQSSELIKVLSEKNLEIKKLQEENNRLFSQVSQLSGTLKRYQKLKSILKKKNQKIEDMRKSTQRSRKSFLLGKDEDKASKSSLKKSVRIKSKLSIDGELVSEDKLVVRPMTAINKGFNTLHRSNKSEIGLGKFTNEMKETLKRAEKVLNGWKKHHKLT